MMKPRDIIGMELFPFAGEGVGVGGRERRFAEAADGVEHVRRPAALRNRAMSALLGF
jgi:hypothetical protein